MNKTFWNLLLASPAVLGMSFVVSAAAIAQEAPTAPESNQEAIAQKAEQTEAVAIAAPEALTLNTSASPAQEIAAVSVAEPQNQPQINLDSNAQTLESEIKLTSETASVSAAVTPLTADTTPQASDLSLQTESLQAAPVANAPVVVPEPVAQVPATGPAIGGPILPASPSMGGPILPASPSTQPSSQSAQPASGMAQVTSVSQLSDVQPTDWAFQALQSLVERYGCIAGYPDGTFRGNRALTRYEFAAGLNACLDQVTRLIGGATGNFVTKEDLAILQRLQEEFAAELATLRGRVDGLEARVTELEANQFSTTTKLNGEVIFGISDTYAGDISLKDLTNDDDDEDDDDDTEDNTSTNLGYRVRLNFNTSFTGRDLLRTRLQARNVARYDRPEANNTNMARLAFDGDEGNQITLDQAWYCFPAGKATVWFGPRGLNIDDIAEPVSPFNSSGSGAVSRFAQRNPAVFRGPEGAGLGFSYAFNRNLRAQVAYLANDVDAPDPSDGRGFFNGSYTAIGQLSLSLGSSLDVGLTYAHKYFRTGSVGVGGGTGSNLAERPFGNVATSTDNFGAQLNFKPFRGFNLGGWVGYTRAQQERGGDDKATIMNAAVTLAFPDLGRRGNLLGFVVGVPPKVTSSDAAEDDKTSLHIEGFYRLQVTDFISITPGVFVITNPNHNEDNDTIYVGVLRTTFSF